MPAVVASSRAALPPPQCADWTVMLALGYVSASCGGTLPWNAGRIGTIPSARIRSSTRRCRVDRIAPVTPSRCSSHRPPTGPTTSRAARAQAHGLKHRDKKTNKARGDDAHLQLPLVRRPVGRQRAADAVHRLAARPREVRGAVRPAEEARRVHAEALVDLAEKGCREGSPTQRRGVVADAPSSARDGVRRVVGVVEGREWPDAPRSMSARKRGKS